MKKKRITTLDGATSALGVRDVSEINSSKAVEFIELLPRMTKEVAFKLLDICPDLIQITPEVLNAFERMNASALQNNSESNIAVIQAYQTIIDACKKAIEDGNLTFEEKEKILNMMIELADKMSAKDTENKQWIDAIVSKTAKYGFTALGAVAGIIALVVFAKDSGDDSGNDGD